jgi:hypothetical protein
MNPRYLTVDGMLSGTGVRNSIEGGYIDPAKLGLSVSTVSRIKQWLARYEDAHYAGFGESECTTLDQEGISISEELQAALPEYKVEYFSHARQTKMTPPTPDLPPSTPLG